MAKHMKVRKAQWSHRRRSAGGFTLIELMIAVVLIALGIAGIYAGVSAYMSNSRANQEMTDLPIVITNIQAKYSQRQTFAGVTTAGLINLGVFPQSWVNGATVTNRWGGAITVAAATVTTANDAVAVTSPSVPQAECVDVVPAIEQRVRVITVNGTTVKANNALTDMDALGTACAAGGNANAIVYTIGKA